MITNYSTTNREFEREQFLLQIRLAREAVLQLLETARANGDREYAAEAAGFWLCMLRGDAPSKSISNCPSHPARATVGSNARLRNNLQTAE